MSQNYDDYVKARDVAEKHHQGMHGPSKFKKGHDACFTQNEIIKAMAEALEFTVCGCDRHGCICNIEECKAALKSYQEICKRLESQK